MKSLKYAICGIFLAGCGLLNSTTNNANSGKIFSGEASYYANSLHGRKTASGELYDKNKLTAAHKTLPFQTKVEVKNLSNGKIVTVKINDRLPASSKRSIDLSEAAAKQLGMLKAGVVKVQLKVLGD